MVQISILGDKITASHKVSKIDSLELRKETYRLGPGVFCRFFVMSFPSRTVKRVPGIRVEIEVDSFLIFC